MSDPEADRHDPELGMTVDLGVTVTGGPCADRYASMVFGAHFTVHGGGTVGGYQPKHSLALDRDG